MKAGSRIHCGQRTPFLPTFIWLYPTYACNLNCRHCSVALLRNLDIGNVETWIRALDLNLLNNIKKTGAKIRIKISGGEPLILKDKLFDILKVINEFSEKIFIETNGTLVNSSFIEKLVPFHGKIEFSVSIDGLEETHDKIRGKIGAFRSAIQGLKLLNKYGMLNETITVIQDENIRELDRLVKYLYNDLNVTKIRLLLPIRLGRGRLLIKNFEDILRLYKVIVNILRKYKDTGINFTHNIPPALLPKDLWSLMRPQLCGWGRDLIGVLPNLDIGVCGDIQDNRLTFGNIKKRSIIEVLSSSKLAWKLAKMTQKDKRGVCRYCLAWKICRGFCLVESFYYYGELEAPGVLCQEFYNNTMFPNYALEEETPKGELEYP